MPTYIVLSNWTDQGIKSVKESPKRFEAAKAAFRNVGGEIKSTFLTLGEYDFVIICEAPDDATIAKLALATGMQGAIRTKTLKAFTESEYLSLVQSL